MGKNSTAVSGEVEVPSEILHGHPFEVECLQKCWIPPEQNTSRLLSLSFRHTNGSLQTLSTVGFVHTESGLINSTPFYSPEIEVSTFKQRNGLAFLNVRIKNVSPFQLGEFRCGLHLNSTNEIYFSRSLFHSKIRGYFYFLFIKMSNLFL